MPSNERPAPASTRARWNEHPWALDATLIAFVTAVAAALRLTLLGTIPYGVHPDEAQLGTDAHKILDGNLIGIYTHAALGQPAGHSYLTLPSIWLLGDNAFALRLPLALVGLAAIPLLYLLVRIAFARTEAFFASMLLAISYWHVLYSRVAHWSISYGTVLLAALLCLMLGVRAKRRAWFAASGAILGLGVYTYNVYPIAVAAVAIAIAIITFTRYRGDRWRWWRGSMFVLFGVALLVALPMIIYIARPYSYYWSHVRDYSTASVTNSPEFRHAGLPGKARLLAEQAGTFINAYAGTGERDYVDASGARAMFDWPTLALLVAGLIMAARRWRDPMIIVAFCCFVVIPLPAVFQQGSITRQPLGAAPYAMFFAALPLAAVWRVALQSRERWRYAAFAGITAVVAMLAAITTRDYFPTWRDDEIVAFVYHAEITSASEYMATLPHDDQIYFYSDRHPFRLETRQFLAPAAHGVDRSSEFSTARASIRVSDRSHTIVFVLLGTYHTLLPELERTYPEGHTHVGTHNGTTEFIAYELPPLP